MDYVHALVVQKAFFSSSRSQDGTIDGAANQVQFAQLDEDQKLKYSGFDVIA